MDRGGANPSTVVASWTMAIWQGLARMVRAAILIEEERPYRPEAPHRKATVTQNGRSPRARAARPGVFLAPFRTRSAQRH